MSTTAISIRLDSDIKDAFDNLCKEFGISSNAAFNLFARTVVRQKAIPFPISLDSKFSDTAQRAARAQSALEISQSISSQEKHIWTDEEIDELISSFRKQKKQP